MHIKSFAFKNAYTTYPVKPQLANQYGDIELDEMRRVHSKSFAMVFIKHLKKNNIHGQVVAIVPSNLGHINNIGLFSEIEFGVYVPAIKKIFWTIDNFSMAGEIPIYTSDCNALIVQYSPSLNWKNWQWENYKTPLSLAADNVINTNLDIIVNEDYSLAISSKVSFFGIYRKRYNPLFLYQIDPHKKLNYKSKIGRLSSVAKKREEQKDENAALKRKAITEWLKENYSIDTMLSYTVSPTASILKNKALTVDFEFTSNDYLKKAGPNLIFNVGELITGQISLDQEEVDNRTMDIQLGFARKHINNIKIKLPEGTSIKGLEKLQMNVSNDAGAFVSEASQKGDILHIKTTKIYKQENIDKARWKELVEMLEAAYDFSQQKVILRKK